MYRRIWQDWMAREGQIDVISKYCQKMPYKTPSNIIQYQTSLDPTQYWNNNDTVVLVYVCVVRVTIETEITKRMKMSWAHMIQNIKWPTFALVPFCINEKYFSHHWLYENNTIESSILTHKPQMLILIKCYNYIMYCINNR